MRRLKTREAAGRRGPWSAACGMAPGLGGLWSPCPRAGLASNQHSRVGSLGGLDEKRSGLHLAGWDEASSTLRSRMARS